MKELFRENRSRGITDVPGFEAAGVSCDIRGLNNERLDVALVYSPLPCNAAGVFTTNCVPAASVKLCRRVLNANGSVHGIIANSGNANAWTGRGGMVDAEAMATIAQEGCATGPDSFLVCSTGHIGLPLPMSKLKRGIQAASETKGYSAKHGIDAASAILTTDTATKVVTVKIPWKRKLLTVSGMAKGAGMIHPQMATMLAFVATDALVSRTLLQKTLKEAVTHSFNAITVDGDRSTNDTVLLLANGHSGIKVAASSELLLKRFTAAIQHVCSDLAEKIVCDGEKITKVVELLVEGAATRGDAEKIARAVGNSILVKTSWFGNDPNYGRILDAVGYAGAQVKEEKLEMAYRSYPATPKKKPVPVVVEGEPIFGNESKWDRIVSADRFSIQFNLNLGKGSFRLLATDLTEGYVSYNKSEKV